MATVRSARSDDVNAIGVIKATGWATTYAGLVPDDVLAKFTNVEAQRASIAGTVRDRTMVVLVAMLGDDTVGFAVCRWDDPAGGYLDSLHVLPEARGRGVGWRLLTGVARELNERGVSSMYLHVVEGNDAAGRFYECHGAELIGSAPAAWAPTVTELIYRWPTLEVLLGPLS